MAQQTKALATLAEDLALVPGTHTHDAPYPQLHIQTHTYKDNKPFKK